MSDYKIELDGQITDHRTWLIDECVVRAVVEDDILCLAVVFAGVELFTVKLDSIHSDKLATWLRHRLEHSWLVCRQGSADRPLFDAANRGDS